MPTKRMTLLAKILEEGKLRKLAQDAQVEGEGEVSQQEADQLADQIFDQLFDETVQNLGK